MKNERQVDRDLNARRLRAGGTMLKVSATGPVVAHERQIDVALPIYLANHVCMLREPHLWHK